MQGDFSTMRFDPTKHFSAVLSQQGRVTLDSDANEGVAALLHYVRTAVGDILGPASFRPDDTGFLISAPNPATDGLEIGAGRAYVDGILVENDAATTYWTQPDGYLDPDDDELPQGPFLVYLRVWERLITAIQDPSIREVALGQFGPDTAARAKVVWQVAARATDLGGSPPPSEQDALDWIKDNLIRTDDATPQLQARLTPSTDDAPCDVSPDSMYRGPENQLYRVEAHAGGIVEPPEKAAGRPAPTFKWSRENASVTFPITAISGNAVTLGARGRDDKLDLHVEDWVEIVDDRSDLRAADDFPTEPAPALRQVTAIDYADLRVTLDDDDDGYGSDAVGADRAPHPFLRRWEQNAVPIVEDTWLDIEDGIQVRFDAGLQGVVREYRRGDFWWIPARVVTGGIDWPTGVDGTPAARPPHGVQYHYAPLAWINGDATVDLRHTRATFQPRPRTTPRKAPAKKAAGGG
jgi:hypothetical protein